MKQFIVLLFVLLGSVSATWAQAPKKAVMTATISTPNALCEECKQRIEAFMAREEGVTKTVVDFKRKVTKVTWITDKTNIENIKTALANLGFDADDVTANPEFYNKLPPCCKKPVGPAAAPPGK